MHLQALQFAEHLGRFDILGDHGNPHFAGQRADAGDEGVILLAVQHVGDEIAFDLQVVDRETAQVVEGRET